MTRIEALMERDEEIRKTFYSLHPDVRNLVDYIYAGATDIDFENLVRKVGIQVTHGNQGWKYGRGAHPEHYIFTSKVNVASSFGVNATLSIRLHCIDGLAISLLMHFGSDDTVSVHPNTLRLASLYLLAHSDHMFQGLGERAYTGELNIILVPDSEWFAKVYLTRFLFDVRKGEHTEVLRELIKHSGEKLNDILDLCNQYQLDELTMVILRIIEEEGINVGQEQFRL